MQIFEVFESPDKCKWKPLRFENDFYAQPKYAEKYQVKYKDAHKEALNVERCFWSNETELSRGERGRAWLRVEGF